MNKKLLFQIIAALIVSILIGFTSMGLARGSFDLPIQAYLWNSGYSVFIGMALFGNGYFFNKLEKKYIFWIDKPYRSISIAICFHLVYSTIVILVFNWVWFYLVLSQRVRVFWKFEKSLIVQEYVIFVIIALILYASSFFKAWRQKVVEAEKLKLEAVSLKYKILQNQVNPHFLFNSLNVLGSLIEIDTEKAKTFTRELSMFYRDVLFFKDMEIISLREEIDFVKKYIYLQEIRFGTALDVEFCISGKIEGKVIPLSIQMLVENAIKHNEMSIQNPLKIVIAVTDDFELIVENNLQPKKVDDSSKTGLNNLIGRYEYLTGKKVVVNNKEHYFRVVLPLIKVED